MIKKIVTFTTTQGDPSRVLHLFVLLQTLSGPYHPGELRLLWWGEDKLGNRDPQIRHDNMGIS